jgi:hypothetical protein
MSKSREVVGSYVHCADARGQLLQRPLRNLTLTKPQVGRRRWPYTLGKLRREAALKPFDYVVGELAGVGVNAPPGKAHLS